MMLFILLLLYIVMFTGLGINFAEAARALKRHKKLTARLLMYKYTYVLCCTLLLIAFVSMYPLLYFKVIPVEMINTFTMFEISMFMFAVLSGKEIAES